MLSVVETLVRDEDEESKGVIQLTSSKLCALRSIRHFRIRAQDLEPFIRDCLDDSDDAVRKSAELARRAIRLPAPEPKRPLARDKYHSAVGANP